MSSTLFADPEAEMDMATYSDLLRYGFRRSGRMVYAPRCEHCQQCVSVRVPVADFTLRRSQRRVLQRNADIELREHPARFNPEHYRLYQRYMVARHADGDMADALPADYLGFLRAEWCQTTFLEFLLDGELVALAATDVADHGLSAVYTFFDPDQGPRSLGTFAVLRQIEHARSLGLAYLYLGYWIQDCRKMAYKVNFRPIELWRAGQWRRLMPGASLPE
jgi:arginine-tRNA-protein transferase